MPKTISSLIVDTLPRLVNAPKKGISIYQAANSIQSLIAKHLMERNSDLIATDDLFLVIPAYDYKVPLPSDFLAMAEKPRAVQAPDWVQSSAWMAGTVTSYDTATKTLVLNVIESNGSGTLASWYIAVGVMPGWMVQAIDTSTSSLAVGTGAKTIVTDTELDLAVGQNLIISNEELPTDSDIRATIDQEWLDDDDHDDYWYWDHYKMYGDVYETAATCPRKFKIVGTDMYFRPKVTNPVMVTGKYKAKPADFTAPDDEIPWNDLFYEVFREGVVRIITKQVSIPEVDQDFMILFKREVDTVLNARFKPLPQKRTYRRTWL